MAKLTNEDWQTGRDKMTGICIQCHSINFATSELDKGDDMIRTADSLMAAAIRIVASLYEDGLLEKPEGYAHAFPDLLAFQDATTPIEQTLWVILRRFARRLLIFERRPAREWNDIRRNPKIGEARTKDYSRYSHAPAAVARGASASPQIVSRAASPGWKTPISVITIVGSK